VDATNICNLKCTFCHYYEFRKEQQRTVPSEELLALPDIIKKLGAYSVCFAGGGEPLLHPDAGLFMRKLKDIGINIDLVTNGVFIDKFIDDILYSCRWVGISVDAATINTYKELKGGSQNDFVRVINNIRLIADRRKDNISPSVGFKFLIHPINYMEILDAIRLARSIGADDFHGRPAYHRSIKWDEQIIEHALEQIIIGQNIFETQKFHVFGVTHKFDKTFIKKVVDKCEVTPIAGLTFAADGFVYLCCDLRGEEMGRLCRWNEILDVWGSDKHKEMIKKIDPRKCPYRCTFNFYQEILDEVFRKDKMSYKFP
jgi:MoaA/NifB/PqqE/SkfB family radical SAM enzyme